MTEIRAEILEPLRRSLDWLLSLRDGDGRIVCPEHKLEHTGKSACAAITAAELWRHAEQGPERDGFLAAARQQGRRLVANLVREDTGPCHTFRPGRHDPFNCSNSVIDGGACSDALAHLVAALGVELAAEDREAFAQASLLHARTYLRYAVLDKGIPAQRAWGLTGLAAAHALEGGEADGDLARAALEAVGLLEGIQHGDGSYPYHPLAWGAVHPGASDVSAFYQSRLTAFLIFALERLGHDPTDARFRGSLERGLDFLCALQGPDGIKTGMVEAKPWYWGAAYEVASHPFDVYALASGFRLFGKPRYAVAAARAHRAWVAHLGLDGRPKSHAAGAGRGRSYQCPVFWAAHACWLARAAEDLEAILATGADREPERGPDDCDIEYFPEASLVRLEDARVVAWVRGGRPACNVHHGSPHGAGLIRVVSRPDARDLVERCRLGGANEAEWTGKKGLPSLVRGLSAGGSELRFAMWLARVHARAGRRKDALLEPLRVFKRGVLAFGHARVGSAFDLAPVLEVKDHGVTLTGRLAHRDGTPVARSSLRREYRVDGRGLVVEERLERAGGARAVAFQVPRAASDVERNGTEIRYRLG